MCYFASIYFLRLMCSTTSIHPRWPHCDHLVYKQQLLISPTNRRSPHSLLLKPSVSPGDCGGRIRPLTQMQIKGLTRLLFPHWDASGSDEISVCTRRWQCCHIVVCCNAGLYGGLVEAWAEKLLSGIILIELIKCRYGIICCIAVSNLHLPTWRVAMFAMQQPHYSHTCHGDSATSSLWTQRRC